MCERQLDLFSASGIPPQSRAEPRVGPPELVPADLDDAALIAAIPPRGRRRCARLGGGSGAAAAGGRGCRPGAALPALRRVRPRARGARAGRSASGSCADRRPGGDASRGPTDHQEHRAGAHEENRRRHRRTAQVGSARRDRAGTPAPCRSRCARRCLSLHRCMAGGHLGPPRSDRRQRQQREDCGLLRARAPGPARGAARARRPAARRAVPEIIEAVPRIADEDCVIVLGRIVRTRPALADVARDALETIDHPRARQVLAALTAERDQPGRGGAAHP